MYKAFIISLLFTSVLNAQELYFGDPPFTSEKTTLGLVQLYRATDGISLNGTNVESWADLASSTYHLQQFSPTNQPTSVLFGTNMLGTPMKAVYFEANKGNAAEHLKADNAASMISGVQKPFTVISVVNAQTNQTVTLAAWGWSSATNVNGSRMGMRPSTSTSPTQGFFFKANNTNSISAQCNLANKVSTNVWHVFGASFDGSVLTIFSNLSATTNYTLSTSQSTTLDMFTIGGSRHFNITMGNAFTTLALAEFRVYTNGLTGSQWTNEVNKLNTYYQLF